MLLTNTNEIYLAGNAHGNIDFDPGPGSAVISNPGGLFIAKYSQIPFLAINNLPSSVCINSPPVQVTGLPPGGTFTGNGMTGNIFYPGSAGIGMHSITYTFTNSTGLFDTTETILVNPLPQVSFTGLPDTLCLNSPIISLNPVPPGGAFSGNGMSGNIFFAFAAGQGIHTISYQYTDSNGCTGSYLQNVFVDVCSGINSLENQNSHIRISPNPAPGKFTIRSGNEKINQITITSISSQTIFKKEFENDFNSEIEIDLTHQSKGIYLMQAVTNKKVFNQKIILN